MTIGAILLRVSSQVQAENDKASYGVQRDACLAYATARGIDVPDDLIWQEIATRGQYFTRDGLQAALAAARGRKYETLIVWRMDRLTDDPGRLMRLVEELDGYGVQIGYATEPDTDTTTELGRWLAYTKALFQVNPERKTLALRTSEARKAYIARGRPWAGNRPRFGYKWIVDEARTRRVGAVEVPLKERLEVDPLAAPVVQQLYAWVDEGRSLHWIARALSGLEDGGIHKKPTPRQHANLAGANRDGQWIAESIIDMLRFPGYMGKWPALRTKRKPRNDGSEKVRQESVPEDAWVWVEPSPAPPLVDAALWYRVQTRLTNNHLYSARNTKQSRGPEDALLYRGMARCERCGGRLDVLRIWSANKTTPARYRYACTTALRHPARCDGLGYQAATAGIDHAVWTAFLGVLQQPETLTRLARRSYERDHANDGVADVTPIHEHAALQKKLTDKEQELQNLTARSAGLAPGNPALLGFDLAIASLGSEVAALRDECEQARRKAAKFERVERLVGQWHEYVAMWADNLNYLSSTNFTPAHRRQWLEALGARVIVIRRAPGRPLATLRLHLTLLDRGGAVKAGDAGAAFPVLPTPLPEPRDPMHN